MNFYQKHTYLIWQLIGWGLVLAAFIVLLVNLNDYNHDYILGSIVFLTMFGTFAIFVSPLVIWLRKRDKAEQERNRCIIELHSKLHPVQEVILVLIVIFIFFRGDHSDCAVRTFLFVSAWFLSGGSTVFTSPVRCQKEILSNSRRGKVLSDF